MNGFFSELPLCHIYFLNLFDLNLNVYFEYPIGQLLISQKSVSKVTTIRFD